MEVLTPLAWLFYGIVAVVALFVKGSVKVRDLPVKNPIARVLSAMVMLPFMGVVFFVLGLIGHFLLLPFLSMF